MTTQIFNFNNDKTRREFIDNFKDWGVWYVDKLCGVTYFKCELPDGTQLIVAQTPDTHWIYYGSKQTTTSHYRHHIIRPGKSFCLDANSASEVLGVLHPLRGQVEIKVCFDTGEASHNEAKRLRRLIDKAPLMNCHVCNKLQELTDWLVHNGVSVADSGTSTETEAHND